MISGALLAWFAVVSPPLAAQLPVTQLSTLRPPGGRIGTEVSVTITGATLDDVDRILFSHPGITSTQKTTDPLPFQTNRRPVAHEFLVNIAGDVPPGIYEARAVGRFGISNPRRFVVGSLAESIEAANISSPSTPMFVETGSTVNGRVDPDQIDYFKFAASQGQRLLIDCVGQRIDSKIDASLVLIGPDGAELQRVHDTEQADPVLDLVAPADGEYVVGVHDVVYRGGDEFFYRFSLQQAPYVAFVFPPVGQPGSNDAYTIYGTGLPDGQPSESVNLLGRNLEQLQVNIALPGAGEPAANPAGGPMIQPHAAGLPGTPFSLVTRAGHSNAVMIGHATGPVVIEDRPNNDPGSAHPVDVPCEYVGQFYPRGDRDWISFSARKGDIVWLDLMSHRLGTAADPYLLVQKVTTDGDGNEQVSQVVEVDDVGLPTTSQIRPFNPESSDPSYRLVADADAMYRVLVADLYADSRADPRFVYRLGIRRSAPDYQLIAYCPPQRGENPNDLRVQSAVLRQGGAAVVRVRSEKSDGFTGDVELTVEGLPDGVTCHPATLGGSVEEASLVLQADAAAPAWSGAIRVVGRSNIGGQDVVRYARGATMLWPTADANAKRPVARAALDIGLSVAAAETAPALVKLGDGTLLETSLGGALEVPITVTRYGEFKGEIVLTPYLMPEHFQPGEVKLEGDEGKLALAFNNASIPTGTYTFHMIGAGTCQHVRNPDAVKRVEAEQQTLTAVVSGFEAKVQEGTAARDADIAASEQTRADVATLQQRIAAVESNLPQVVKIVEQAEATAATARAAAGADPENTRLGELAAAAGQTAVQAVENRQATEQELSGKREAVTAAEARIQEIASGQETQAAVIATAKANRDKAQAAKAEIDKRLEEVRKANEPKDVTFRLVTTPVRVRVAPSPVDVKLSTEAFEVDQGQQIEIPIAVTRKYGFEEAVEIFVETKRAVGGVEVPKIDIAKDQSEGTLSFAAAPQATPGEHEWIIKSRVKFKDLTLEDNRAIKIKINQVEPQASN